MKQLKSLGLAALTSALFATNTAYGQQASKQAKDTLDVGFALQEQDIQSVLEATAQLNSELEKDKLYINISETPEISIKSYSSRELPHLMKNSFHTHHDLYMGWVNQVYIKEKNKFDVETERNSNVTLMMGSVQKEHLKDIMYTEIAKHLNSNHILSEKKNLSTYNQRRKKQAQSIYAKAEKKNLVEKIKSKKPTQSNLQDKFDQKREISYTLILNDFEEEKAVEIMKEVNKDYQTQFNISYELEKIIRYPEKKLKGETNLLRYAKKQSDSEIYIAFTGNDWNIQEGSKTYKAAGAALVDKGIVWFEARKDNPERILKHELAHLFGAEHSWNKQAIIHPQAGEETYQFIPATSTTILKHKFKKFN